MRLSRRDGVLATLLIVSLVTAVALRRGLDVSRSDLSPREGGVPGESSSASSSAIAGVLSPASGFFRPLAVNALWLRSSALQRKKLFFESASLAAGIAELQPRLPSVWSFQAWNLAFNIAGSSAPEDRYRWVLEALRLLRDSGLDYNPGAASIYRDLSWLFFFKIDGIRDDARLLYRFAFARGFEIDSGLPAKERSAELSRRMREWRVDASFLDELARRYLLDALGPDVDGTAFDLRIASTHGLYWAAAGLAQPERPSDRWERFLLGRFIVSSLDNLLDHGRIVRSPVRDAYAYVPDLRFARAVEKGLDDEAERYSDEAFILAEIDDARRDLRRRLALFLLLWNRGDDAERIWRESEQPDRGGERTGTSLERFASLQVIRSEDRPRSTRADAVERLGQLARGVLGFALAGEADLAAGLHRIARSFETDWNESHVGDALPTVEACLNVTARAWNLLLERDPSTASLAARLRGLAPAAFRGDDRRLPADLGLRPPRAESDAQGIFLFLPGLDSLGPRASEFEKGGR